MSEKRGIPEKRLKTQGNYISAHFYKPATTSFTSAGIDQRSSIKVFHFIAQKERMIN